MSSAPPVSVIEGRTFEHLRDDGGRLFEDLELRRCRFVGGCLGATHDVGERSVVRRVRVVDCDVVGSRVRGAILEEVAIDGLRTNSLFQIWGAALKHVTLRGKVGRVMISDLVDTTNRESSVQRAFDRANAEYYRSVDWALDISHVEAEELDLRGVPGRLVRRDPAAQILVTRERAMAGTWRAIDFGRSAFDVSIELLLERGRPDIVLSADKRGKRFKDDIRAIELLRAAGVAEPD